MSEQLESKEIALSEAANSDECANCGFTLIGGFCHNCGQKKLKGRFTLKSSISSFFSVIANVDKGLWHTTIWMFTKPQALLKDYLNGATIKYFHPFRYLFLWLTIQVFLMVSIIDMESITMNMIEPSIDAKQMEFQRSWMHFVYSYNHLLISASIPFLALAYWVVFGVKKYNFGEQLIITAYSYGQVVVLGIIVSFLYLLNLNVIAVSMSSLALTFLYLNYVNIRFFKGSGFKIFLRTILAFLIYIILFLLAAFIAGIAFIFLKAILDPEFVKQFKQASSTT